MPYLNDVFISYKRGKINEQWLNEIFLPFFIDYLDNSLPFQPRIFVDKPKNKDDFKNELTPGVNFNDELFQNLIFSKCLVSIWSPPYFRRSEWCIKEFLTMKFCQEHHQLTAFTNPKTLIWPVMYRRIDQIPLAVKGITYLDYSEFNVVGEAFFRTEKFLKFQEQLQQDIPTISNIIVSAPPFDLNWDTFEGRRKILQELTAYIDENSDFDNPPKQQPISWQTT